MENFGIVVGFSVSIFCWALTGIIVGAYVGSFVSDSVGMYVSVGYNVGVVVGFRFITKTPPERDDGDGCSSLSRLIGCDGLDDGAGVVRDDG